MPIKERNNDQNIKRFRTKMSEGCSSQKNKPKLTGTVTEKLNTLLKNNLKDCFNHSDDHLYPNNTKNLNNLNNSSVNTLKSNRQNCESEVRFLEEWLLLHLDLIQQQNDEIISKEQTIYMLQQENEMLREHINCLKGGVSYSSRITVKNYSCNDMTQDATHIKDDKSLICESQEAIMNNCIKNCGSLNDLLSYNDSILNRTRVKASCDIGADVATNINLSNNSDDKSLCMLRDAHNSIMKQNKTELVVNNYQDSLKNFQMSIRRKRLCSGSSVFSNNTSIDEQQSSRKRKKRSIVIKDEKILTSKEHYVTQASEIGVQRLSSDLVRNEVSSTKNLEVPQWRQRIYSSLYIMEGTENLDDDVFNKRHMRLENDERRRKRWDVQRIREQRVIEKLRLRQERISGVRSDDQTKSVSSLWPTLEDIKYIEVCDELPVSAFGAPVPRFAPSEFSLPWVINPVEPKLEVEVVEQPQLQLETVPVNKLTPAKKPKKRRKTKR